MDSTRLHLLIVVGVVATAASGCGSEAATPAQLGEETAARTSTDAELRSRFDAEEAARRAGDAALMLAIETEAAARKAALETAATVRLAADLDTLASATAYTDGKVAGLQGALDAEVAARKVDAAALQGAVDKLGGMVGKPLGEPHLYDGQGKDLGLSLDGAYLAHVDDANGGYQVRWSDVHPLLFEEAGCVGPPFVSSGGGVASRRYIGPTGTLYRATGKSRNVPAKSRLNPDGSCSVLNPALGGSEGAPAVDTGIAAKAREPFDLTVKRAPVL